MVSDFATVPSDATERLEQRLRAAARRPAQADDAPRPLRFVTKRGNERSQCRRRLPPAGVIEIVAGEGRAPSLKNSLEPPGPDVRRHLVRIDIRDALPRQRGLSN